MEKTIKQIAEELKIDKQKVYRYIKNNNIEEVHHEALHEAHQKNKVKYYDEVAQRQIKQAFEVHQEENEVHQKVHHEAHQSTSKVHQKLIKSTSNDVLLEALQKEIEVKNRQLEEKDKQISNLLNLVDQEQKLRLIAEDKILSLEQKDQEDEAPGRRFFSFFNRKK